MMAMRGSADLLWWGGLSDNVQKDFSHNYKKSFLERLMVEVMKKCQKQSMR